MLDMDQLKEIPEDEMFAHGVVLDGQPYFNFDGKHIVLKWAAIKGYNNDWAIYVLPNEGYNTYLEVRSNGNKVSSKENIQYLVPCTPEVLARYRY